MSDKDQQNQPTEEENVSTETFSDQPAEQPDADTFPREYVERLRKESAGYRVERDQLAELLAVAQRQQIDTQISALGVKPDAVWKTIGDPVELLGENGQPDAKKISAAVTKAKETLGIKPDRVRTGLRSGSSAGPQPSANKFVDAFKPARER